MLSVPEGRVPLVALLGPTNTGKTHQAVERMLEWETGIIGLPLRLLAREIYDRVTTRVGESLVALVTGEETHERRRWTGHNERRRRRLRAPSPAQWRDQSRLMHRSRPHNGR